LGGITADAPSRLAAEGAMVKGRESPPARGGNKGLKKSGIKRSNRRPLWVRWKSRSLASPKRRDEKRTEMKRREINKSKTKVKVPIS